MSLINCKIDFILTDPRYCVISTGKRVTTFEIRETKLYLPVATLSTNENMKLLSQLKSDFKKINQNKYNLK